MSHQVTIRCHVPGCSCEWKLFVDESDGDGNWDLENLPPSLAGRNRINFRTLARRHMNHYHQGVEHPSAVASLHSGRAGAGGRGGARRSDKRNKRDAEDEDDDDGPATPRQKLRRTIVVGFSPRG